MIESLKTAKIAVLNGGFSSEREVSLRSGKNVHEALLRLGYNAFRLDPMHDDMVTLNYDIAFNVLHGMFGEDGTVQALLDNQKIRYTGSGVKASILGMNKWMSKLLLVKHGHPTPAYQIISTPTQMPLNVPFPAIIKPISNGSSVGVVIFDTLEDYTANIATHLEQFGTCLLEELVVGQEITVGVIEKNKQLVALPILELRPKHRFYDYQAKYTPGLTDFVLPAELSAELTQHCQTIAKAVYNDFSAKGGARVDMMVDPVKGPMVLEINTLPGMTDLSDLPAQAKHAGISFDELVEGILESALHDKV